MITNPINVTFDLNYLLSFSAGSIASVANVPIGSSVTQFNNIGFSATNNSIASTVRFQSTNTNSVAMLVTGYNCLGNIVTETVTLPTSGTKVTTTNAYTSLISVRNTSADPLLNLQIDKIIVADTSIVQAVIFLDQIAMTGLTISAQDYLVSGNGTLFTYQIGGTLQPVFNLPTYSGATTGGITPNSILTADFTATGFNYPIFASGAISILPTVFSPVSLSAILISAKAGGNLNNVRLQVNIQQMTAVTR